MSEMMKRTTSVLLSLLPVILALIVAGCSGSQETVTENRSIPVKASVIEYTDQYVARRYTGSLEGEKQAVLYARLAEPVEKVLVKEGQKVAQDDVLMTLDKNGPTSNYTATESEYLNAEKNFTKMKFLYDQGAISEKEFDDSRTAFEVAQAQFDAARRLVEIHTPIAGTVTKIAVSPGDFLTEGDELATVATTGKLRVKFIVNPEEIGYFKVGVEVLVSHESVPDKMTGRVVAVAGSADQITRGFKVEAIIDNPAPRFRPGMFVQIEYVLEHLDSIVAIPREAVLIMDNKPVIYVVKDGRAERREITLGSGLGGKVQVTAGLNPGDTLVTLGQNYLADSSHVNLTALNGNSQ